MENHPILVKSILFVVIAGISGYAGYLLWQNTSLQNKLKDLNASIEIFKGDLTRLQNENTELTSSLASEKNKNTSFEEQIGKISSSVGTLEKLYKTDPQLLQKYSKVYFLNENYIPSRLTDIDTSYTNTTTKSLQIHSGVWPHLEEMLQDARDDDLSIKVTSAYRSFGTQAALKTGYKVLYGSGANQFSADQGYSEHQLGTTVDILAASTTVLTTTFEKTKEYEWLTKNAYKYGFVLSYPKQNTYYQFEPWHWRFVGIKLAKKLHRDGKYFYEMDQRDINTYLADFFD